MQPMTAEAWFARLHAPDFSDEDRRTFDDWLASDPRNMADYTACMRFAGMSARLRPESSVVDELLADSRPRSRSDERQASKLWTIFVTAHPRMTKVAVAIAVLIAVGVALLHNPGETVSAVATTVHGQQSRLALEDGSSVQLNSETVLKWRFTRHERQVILERGEAYFDVAKDPRRRFVVRTGTSEVRVVGTKFSVREADGHLHVVVREGKVEVIPDVRQAVDHPPTKVELTEGKALSFDDGQNIVRVALVDPERVLAWRSGSLDFDALTLEEAVAEVNRYAMKPLVIRNDELRQLRLSGRFRAGDTEAVLFALRERFGVESSEEESQILLR